VTKTARMEKTKARGLATVPYLSHPIDSTEFWSVSRKKCFKLNLADIYMAINTTFKNAKNVG